MASTLGSIDLASLKNLRDDVTQYFWFESNSSSAWGSGAHVTLYPESQFTDSTNPNYMKGQNIIMNTDGFSIRNGGLPMMVLDNDSLDFNAVDTTQSTYTTVATFGLTGARIGQDDTAHIILSPTTFKLRYGNENYDYVEFYDSRDPSTGLTTYEETIGYVPPIPYNPYITQKVYTQHDIDNVNNINWVKVDGVSISLSTISFSWPNGVGIPELGQNNATVEISYKSPEVFKAFTLGRRKDSYETGAFSCVIGNSNAATNDNTFSIGNNSIASGNASMAQGGSSKAIGAYSLASGDQTQAHGFASHAEGYRTVAIGSYSHTQNYCTVANVAAQTVIGKYNKATRTGSGTDVDPYIYSDSGNYAFIIGNGSGDDTDSRSNALTVDWDGNVEAAGGVAIRKSATAQKDLTYVNEYVRLAANQTASESAGQLTLSTSNKSCLVANKYDEVWSDYMNECVSVENGVVTILKSGRYRFDYQVYFYNGFTANDIPTCGIGLNGLNGALLRASRFKTTVTNPYTTLSGSYTGWGEEGNTFHLMAQNSTGARGIVGLSQYTRLTVTCLMTH